MGRIHYPLTNQDGCQPFGTKDFNTIHLAEGASENHRPIIMVDRGNCHFVQKAQNIQRYGGQMALIIDNNYIEDPDHLVMADDGKGQSVEIPSFLISMSDGIMLKEAIH